MKIKIRPGFGFEIMLYTFVTLTVAAYLWVLYSFISWIIKML